MKVSNNRNQHQFEAVLDGHQAELVYRLKKRTLFILHTFVPEEIAGKGVASQLAKEVLEYAKESGYKLAELCPFVAAYIKKHPEWYNLYDKEYHLNLPK